jgi:hypothetical protein
MRNAYYTIDQFGYLTIQRYLENLSLNLSPKRRETLNFPPSLSSLREATPTRRCANAGKGVRGLGQLLAFPHNVKSQFGYVVLAMQKFLVTV